METKDIKAALLAFARQRPGFEFANYGDVTAYRADVRRATRQLNDARAIAAAIPDTMPADYLLKELQSGNRLSLEDGRLDYAAGQYYYYTAGQYYCIEFRAAVARALANALWMFWAEDVKAGEADKIRARARAVFGRGIQQRYFD